jgi:hypothetical protein
MVPGDELLAGLRWGLIEAAAKRDLRGRLFPPGAACTCGVSNPWLLVLGRRPIRCYECRLRERGRTPFEEHHIGGRAFDLVVLLGANRHRLHDAAYQDVLERLPLTSAERVWIELQLFVAFEHMLDEEERKRS